MADDTSTKAQAAALRSALCGRIGPGSFGGGTDAPGLRIEERLSPGVVEVACLPEKGAKRKAIEKVFGARLPSVNAVSHGKLGTAVWVGPGRYLLIGADGTDGNWFASCAGALWRSSAIVTDLSHARLVLHLSGTAARDVLAKGCPVDVEMMSELSAASTTCSGINVTVYGCPDDGFDVAVMRSYAHSFWDWLTEASEEFGYEVG